MTPDETPRADASWKQRYEGAATELDALYASQVELSIENELLRNRLNHYEGSRPLKVGFELIRRTRDLFPVGSKRRKIVAVGARKLLGRPTLEQRAHESYRVWLTQHTPSASELTRQRTESGAWTGPPSFSVCMPVHTQDADVLAESITSVLRQSYENWELCLCADGPPSPAVSEVLRSTQSRDERVKLTVTDTSGGISRATNEALALATGDFVAFLDDDDRLEPHALFLYGQHLRSEPDLDVLYCDEDVVLPGGERVRPFLKPDWSPETALSMNFVTHFVAARRTLVDEVGGLRPERDGAQDHDLILRLTERTGAVRHVPAVLYSWRQSATSTSMTPDAKPWAYEAGRGAVQDALERRGIQGRVEAGAFPGGYRVRYRLPDPDPHVEILIPTRDRVDLLEPCLESIAARTTYGNYSITVVDNDSHEARTRDFLTRRGLNVVDAPGPFNYSAIINRGFASTDSEFVVTLNNDTLVQDPHWLGALLELCAQPGVGAVGCRLVFPDGHVQHEGIVIGRLGPAANIVFDAPGIRLVGAMKVTRDVSAVTGACCLIRRSAWEAIGGFDEDYAIAYNDVDFCLRLRAGGYRVLYSPDVTLIHDESSSRGALHPAKDEARLLRQWSAEIATGDPFFPPGIRLGRSGLELAPGEAQFRGLDAARIRLGQSDPSRAG